MIKKLTCSVAMATYNGQKFIVEQLDSIVNQSRKPDEIVICDDRSTDKTCAIITEYAKRHPDVNIRLNINEDNLGYGKNFLKSVGLTKGDIVFFSDQDDIWHKDKIMKMTAPFETNSQIGAILCKCLKFESDRELDCLRGLCEENGVSLKAYNFKRMCRTFNCGGLNLAVRREIVMKYTSVLIQNEVAHDIPTGIIMYSMKQLYFLNENLVFYRIHNNNVSKPSKSKTSRFFNFERQKKSTFMKHKWLNCCKPIVFQYITDEEKAMYDKEIEFYHISNTALCEANIPKAFSLLRYINNPLIPRKVILYNILATIIIKFNKAR